VLRDTLQEGEEAQRAIVFIDEIDAIGDRGSRALEGSAAATTSASRR